MLISLTVDNFLDLATNSELQTDIISQFEKKFDYVDNGEATWFFGMKITQTKKEIQVDQSASIKLILKEFPEVNPQNVPAVPGKPLTPRDNDEPKVKINYQSLCGQLRYVTTTRPNIEFALNQCC